MTTNTLSANRRDPTRTTTLRNRYVRDVRTRYGRLAKLITKTIVDNDALVLNPGPARPFGNADAAERFDVRTDEDRVAEFDRWLTAVIAAVFFNDIWWRSYVRQAYSRGLTTANRELRAVGMEQLFSDPNIILGQPAFASRLRALVNQSQREMVINTTYMRELLVTILSRQLLNGQTDAAAINDLMQQQLTRVGERRMVTAVRTETVGVWNSGFLDLAAAAGIAYVTAEVEFVTADDGRVCKQCEGLEGSIYTLVEARGVIPVHPSCRCRWRLVIPKGRRRQT